MQLNPRKLIAQFAHMLQLDLFPTLEPVTGPMSDAMQLLSAVLSLIPLQRLLDARRSATGRPPKDRAALATAFIAKAVSQGNRKVAGTCGEGPYDERVEGVCGR